MNDDASVHSPLPHISIENGQREVTSFAYVILEVPCDETDIILTFMSKCIIIIFLMFRKYKQFFKMNVQSSSLVSAS